MQPMMPPATGPTGALLIMFSVTTSSPLIKQTDVPRNDFPSVAGSKDGDKMGRNRGGRGLVETRAAALSSGSIKENPPELGSRDFFNLWFST